MDSSEGAASTSSKIFMSGEKADRYGVLCFLFIDYLFVISLLTLYYIL